MGTELGKSLPEYAFEQMGFVISDKNPTRIDLQVLERSSTIEYFGDAKPQVRGGLFCQDNCAVFGLFLAVGQVVKYVYTCWFDYHCDEDRQVLMSFANQELLIVRFYGSNLQMGRLYIIQNPLVDIIKSAVAFIGGLDPWSPESFENVVSGVSRQLGHGLALWQKLESASGIIDLEIQQDRS